MYSDGFTMRYSQNGRTNNGYGMDRPSWGQYFCSFFLALPAGVQGMHESVIDMFNQQAYYV